MKKPLNKFSARRLSRRLALQALYQWQHTAHSADDMIHQFKEGPDYAQADDEYFQEIVRGVLQHVQAIDATFSPYLDRKVDELTPIELAILREATFELQYRLDVPYKVVINEALELAKTFGTVTGFKYVNGVLDKVARQVRIAEL